MWVWLLCAPPPSCWSADHPVLILSASFPTGVAAQQSSSHKEGEGTATHSFFGPHSGSSCSSSRWRRRRRSCCCSCRELGGTLCSFGLFVSCWFGRLLWLALSWVGCMTYFPCSTIKICIYICKSWLVWLCLTSCTSCSMMDGWSHWHSLFAISAVFYLCMRSVDRFAIYVSLMRRFQGDCVDFAHNRFVGLLLYRHWCFECVPLRFLFMHLGCCSRWVLIIKSPLKELQPVGSRWYNNQWYHHLVYVRFQLSVYLLLHWICLLSQSAFMFLSTVKINKNTPGPLVWEFLITIITSGGVQMWLEKNWSRVGTLDTLFPSVLLVRLWLDEFHPYTVFSKKKKYIYTIYHVLFTPIATIYPHRVFSRQEKTWLVLFISRGNC